MATNPDQITPALPIQPAALAAPTAPAPQKRNQIILERGNGRTWTPPPSARELSAINPFVRCGGPKGHGRYYRRRKDLDKKNWY